MNDKFIMEMLHFQNDSGLDLIGSFFPQRDSSVDIPISIETKFKVFLKVGASPKLLSKKGNDFNANVVLSEDRAKLRRVILSLEPKEEYLIVYDENKEFNFIKDLALMRGLILQVISKENKDFKESNIATIKDENPKMYCLKKADVIFYDKALMNRTFFDKIKLTYKILREV